MHGLHHPTPWAVRLHSYLGTRRLVMAVLALSSLCRGITVSHDPGRTAPGEVILYLELPIWVRITLWTTTGTAALLVAIFGRPRHEWIGWVALALLPVERVFSYAWSFAAWLLPGGNQGTWFAIVYAAEWSCAVIVLGLVSAWREDSEQRLDMTRDNPPPAPPLDPDAG